MTCKALDMATGKIVAIGNQKSDVLWTLQKRQPVMNQRTHKFYQHPLILIDNRLSATDAATVRAYNAEHTERYAR